MVDNDVNKLEGKAVRLNGQESDLQYLSKLYSFTDLRVVELDGIYYLKRSEFDTLSNNWKINERASELIEGMNHHAKQKLSTYNLVESSGSINTFSAGALESINILARAGEEIASGCDVEVKIVDKTQPIHLEVVDPYFIVKCCQHNDMMQKAVTYMNRERNWYNLYKVFEAITSDVGGRKAMYKKDLATKNNVMRRFPYTAQHYRHADKELPSDPMSLFEARVSIENAFSRWVRQKYKDSRILNMGLGPKTCDSKKCTFKTP